MIKKILFIFCFAFSINVYSQDCKNLILNKKDEFTGKQTKTTKTIIFKKGNYEESFLIINKISDNFQLAFIYSNSTTRFANSGVFSCYKGDKIFILLEDSSVISFDLVNDVYTSRSESAGVGAEILLGAYAGLAKSNKTIFEPEYHITISELDILKNKNILKIRVEANGAKGDTGQKLKNIELLINKNEANQFKNDVNCILK